MEATDWQMDRSIEVLQVLDAVLDCRYWVVPISVAATGCYGIDQPIY